VPLVDFPVACFILESLHFRVSCISTSTSTSARIILSLDLDLRQPVQHETPFAEQCDGVDHQIETLLANHTFVVVDLSLHLLLVFVHFEVETLHYFYFSRRSCASYVFVVRVDGVHPNEVFVQFGILF